MNGKEFFDLLTATEGGIGELAKTMGPFTLTELQRWLEEVRPKDAAGKPLDEAAFDALSSPDKERLATRLARLQEAISAFRDGPSDPRSLMYKAYVSNGWLLALVLLVLLSTLGLLWAIRGHWESATGSTIHCGQAPAKTGRGPDAAAQDSSEKKPANPVRAESQSAGADPQAPAGTNSASSEAANKAAEADAQSRIRIVPSSVTLTPCQTQSFRAYSGAIPAGEMSWSDPSTGTLTPEGTYEAPHSISGIETVRITATPAAKAANPAASQNSATAVITLIPAPGPDELAIVTMVMLMGALGGCLHWISSFVIFVGNRQFLRSWVLYYMLMPVEGAALALIVYLLLRVGVLSPASATGGETATSALNTVGIYAFAGLTGLFSKQALQALGDVFNTIFKRVEARDSTNSGKKSS